MEEQRHAVRQHVRGAVLGVLWPASRPSSGEGGPGGQPEEEGTARRTAGHPRCGPVQDRNTVERLINKLKAWRGTAARYGKTPDSYLAALHLRGTVIWLHSLQPTPCSRLPTGPRSSRPRRSSCVGVRREVHPEQVDVVGVQAFQAGLRRGDHVLAAVAGLGDVRLPGGAEGELGGQDEVVAVGGDQLSGQFLRLLELVAVRAGGEGVAGLGESVEDPACLVRSAPAPQSVPKFAVPSVYSEARSPVWWPKAVLCVRCLCVRGGKAVAPGWTGVGVSLRSAGVPRTGSA
ncbi:hypothetical protein J2S50_007113 [Streptomyces sp. DSM 40167]|nr:hypothetical protein [Streptomyces sp. DSM 40167]